MGDPPFDAGGVKLIVSCLLAGVAVPMVGAPGTVAPIRIEKPCTAVPDALLAVTWPVNVPVAVGVPDTAPVVPFSERPGGSAPEVTAKVGAGAPLAAKTWEYATLKLPFGAAPLVKAGGETAEGVTLSEADEGPVPAALVAATEHE